MEYRGGEWFSVGREVLSSLHISLQGALPLQLGGMWRFSLFGFPISVHWMFWLTSAFLGGGMGSTSQKEILALAMFVLAAFVSVLIHELGHAFPMRKFGASRVEIMLYAFGGQASSNRWLGRWQGIVVSLAGPLVQIAFGVLAMLVLRYSANDTFLVVAFLGAFVWVSIVWGLLNLVPIYPMDGGKVLGNLLGPNQVRITYGVSVACAAAVALWALSCGSIFGAMMFGFMAYENMQRLRGEQPSGMLGPQR